MDDRTEQRILDKATYVREAVTILTAKRDELTFQAYRNDREQRDVVEREFETAIEACIDIGRILLRERGDPVPDENAAVFHRLGAVGILDEGTANRMAQAARFRNVLSHAYGNDVNDRDVYNALQGELSLFGLYLDAARSELS